MLSLSWDRGVPGLLRQGSSSSVGACGDITLLSTQKVTQSSMLHDTWSVKERETSLFLQKISISTSNSLKALPLTWQQS